MKKSPGFMGVQDQLVLGKVNYNAGGVTVNFLLGVFLYSMILYVWNDTYLKNDKWFMVLAVRVC